MGTFAQITSRRGLALAIFGLFSVSGAALMLNVHSLSSDEREEQEEEESGSPPSVGGEILSGYSLPDPRRALEIAAIQHEGADDPRFAMRSIRKIDEAAGSVQAVQANAGGGLEASFDARGISFSAAGLSARLEATTLHCDGAERALSEGAAQLSDAQKNRVELMRAADGLGAITEWYLSGELGIEQGFDIDAPSCEEAIAIAMQASGADLTLKGDRIAMRTGSTTVHYGELAAFDALGRGLPSRLDLVGDKIVLGVDVRGAAHPIVIDPLIFTQTQVLTSEILPFTSANSRFFGHATLKDGEQLLIGVPGAPFHGVSRAGTVLRYEYRAGDWRYLDAIEAPGTTIGRYFGRALAISGDLLAVGAHRGNEVFIFERAGHGWEFHSRIHRPSTVDFGVALAFSGDHLLVGGVGSAHLYRLGSDEFTFVRSFEGSENFGTALALSDRYLVVAGYHEQSSDVRVFEASDGSFQNSEAISIDVPTPESPQTNMRFGHAVALHGDRLAIGASMWTAVVGADPGENRVSTGIVFLFERSPSGEWVEQERFLPHAIPSQTYCGEAIALSAEYLIWGCTGASGKSGWVEMSAQIDGSWMNPALIDDGNSDNSLGRTITLAEDGTLLVTQQTSSNWIGDVQIYTPPLSGNQKPAFTLSMPTANYARDILFGYSVALSEDRAVISAPTDRSSNSGTNEPTVMVYERVNERWEIEGAFYASNENSERGWLGASVAIEGDTILVGGTPTHLGRTNGGSVADYSGYGVVFEKEWGEWVRRPPLHRPEGRVKNDFMGAAVALEGGVAVIGAPYHGKLPDNDDPAPELEAGKAFIFEWIGNNWQWSATLEPDSPTGRYHFGAAVAKLGDRVFVGSPRFPAEGDNARGAVFVYVDRGEGVWELESTIVASDGAALDTFGQRLAAHGSSLIVGAPGADQARGAVYHYDISKSPAVETRITIDEAREGDRFGAAVAVHGDRVLVGAPGAEVHPVIDAGRAFLFKRRGESFELEHQFSDETVLPEAGFGGAVALGSRGLLIGAPKADTDYGRANAGRVLSVSFLGEDEELSCSTDEECGEIGSCVDGICCFDGACSSGGDDAGVSATREEPATGLCTISSPRSAFAQLLGIGLVLFAFSVARRRRSRFPILPLLVFALFGLLGATAAADAPGDEAESAALESEASERSSAKDSAQDSEAIARAQFRLGEAYLLEGRFVEAGAAFESAYKASGRAALLYNAYVAYRDGQELERAAEALRAYLAADPSQDTSLMRGRLAALEEEIARREEVRAREEAERLAKEAEEAAAALEAERAAESGAEGTSSVAGMSGVQAANSKSRVLSIALMGGGAGVALIGFTTGGALLKHQRGRLEGYCGASAGLADGLCYNDPIVDEVGGKTAGLRGLAYGSLAAGAAIASVGLYLFFRGRREDRPLARAIPTFECDSRQCSIGVVGSF